MFIISACLAFMVVAVFAAQAMDMCSLFFRIFLMSVAVFTIRAMDMRCFLLRFLLMIVTMPTARTMNMWLIITAKFSLIVKSFLFIITAGVLVNSDRSNQHIIQLGNFDLCCLVKIGYFFFGRSMIMMLATLAPVCMLMKKFKANKVDHKPQYSDQEKLRASNRLRLINPLNTLKENVES